MDEHKDEFEAESARRPLQRLFQEYVDQEPAALDKALQLAKSGARRAVNVRATPRPDVPQKNPNVCLKPDTDTHRPAWACKLCNGEHALLLKDTGAGIVIFVGCCAGKFVAFA